MTIFQRLRERARGKPEAEPTRALVKSASFPDWALATADAERWSMPDYGLADNQAKTYQAISWVNTAIQVVGNMVALQPFQVMKLEGERRVSIANHELELLLEKPNPMMSRYELLFATVAYRKICGTAYWWLNRANETAKPDEIWIIPTHRIKPIPDGRMYIRGYEYDPGDGKLQELPPWQIISFRNWHPRNEFVGLSDIECLAVVVEGDQKMSKWNTNFFAEDNAKFPGILTFEQRLSDTEWERVQKEFREAHGGGRRNLRMLRGVGSGGIEWIQTNISQKDMEFLEGRNFNREEIFGVMAPGLASMLAINVTEANSLTGKKTLIDMAVWPALVQIAGKINSTLLPLYEGNLIGEFEDLRVVDRAMQLQEEDQYAKVHTIDEIRDKFYQGDPIGDERGKMLLAEVGPNIGARGLPLVDQRTNEEEPGENQEREEENTDRREQIAKARHEELARWRRYAGKRSGTKAAQFNPEHLPEDVAAVIKARLQAATGTEEVSAAFAGPF